MKGLSILALLLFFTSCKDVRKPDYKTIEKSSDNAQLQAKNEHPGKKLMETLCYACHNATTPEESRLAPPMIAIKRRYLMGGQTKEEFINDILIWIKEPSLEKSKMFGAVDRFGVMPYLPTSEENVLQIAEYLYDYDIEQPEWFEEHFQSQHGQGMGKRKGMGKGMGSGNGKQMQKRMGQNSATNDYSEIGLKYALSTKAQLGKNLMKAIEEKGTVGAMEFCNLQAIKLTDSMSVMHNAIIKRVSDKPRNPNNLANQKELDQIAAFKNLVEKEEVMDVEPIVDEVNGEVNFYYPITTNAMCLQCHGVPNEQITPETLSALKKLYPLDKAKGYNVGQVRGIWSIKFDTNSVP